MVTTTTSATPWLALGGFLTGLAILAILVGFVLVTVGLTQFFRSPDKAQGPEEILRSRFAKGEISRADYEEMLRTVRGETT